MFIGFDMLSSEFFERSINVLQIQVLTAAFTAKKFKMSSMFCEAILG